MLFVLWHVKLLPPSGESYKYMYHDALNIIRFYIILWNFHINIFISTVASPSFEATNTALEKNYLSQDPSEKKKKILSLRCRSRDDPIWLPSRSNGGASLTTKPNRGFVPPLIRPHELDSGCRRSSLSWPGRWARLVSANWASGCLWQPQVASLTAKLSYAKRLIWQLTLRLAHLARMTAAFWGWRDSFTTMTNLWRYTNKWSLSAVSQV